MMRIDAWHLPGLEPDELASCHTRDLGDGIELRFAVLRPGAITRLAARLRSNRLHALVDRPVAGIIDVIDQAVARMTGPGEMRTVIDRVLPAASGLSPAMCAHVVAGMARDWRAPALRALLAAELDGGAMLDGFVPRGAGHVRAGGPPLVCHIMAGNVPGIAVTSLVRALLVRSASILKTGAGEPLLAPLFARALAEVDAELGACVAVTHWPGGTAEPEDEAFAAAELAVVYGGADTIRAVRRRAPAHLSIVEHGPRISLGLVGAAALESAAGAAAVAADVAYATAAFDQHGCVSPQLVYVENGGAVGPRDFAAAVADAFVAVEAGLPRGRLSHADAAALREMAAAAEFGAANGDTVELFETAGATIIYDAASPGLEGSCLNRALRIKAVARLEDVPELIAPYRDVLQSVALAGVSAERRLVLAARLAAVGVTRITDFPRLPWPSAAWHHDGRGPLLELLRFVDLDS